MVGARLSVWLAVLVCLAAANSLPSHAHAAIGPASGWTAGEHIVFPRFSSLGLPPAVTAANVGDVDGDGLEDSAVVFEYFGFEPKAWVTLSSASLPSTVNAGEPGWRGFRISGGGFWHGVAGLGDVNGDGLGEVVVNDGAGLTVVFGRTDGATVNVASLGDDGFRIANVSAGGGGGSGHVCCGTALLNGTFVDVGDQSGDGRPDLAFRDGRLVRVAYTPAAPAGATLDADHLDTGGYTLDPGSDPDDGDPFVGVLGDLDDDDRDELAVAWRDGDDDATRAVGIRAPDPGDHVDLEAAADLATGFELVAPGRRLENAVAIGDQNADGRRDIGLITYGDFDLSMVIGYTPEFGTRRTIAPPAPGEGVEIDVYNDNVHDVGDQDGDGRADLGFAEVVRLSRDGRILFVARGLAMVVGSVKDRNGDGRREVMAVHADPYREEPLPSEATWRLDTFLSAPIPPPETGALPPPGPPQSPRTQLPRRERPPAFGPRTRVSLTLRAQGRHRGQMRVDVSNANPFPVRGRLSGATAIGPRTPKRIELPTRTLQIAAGAKRTFTLGLPRAARRLLALRGVIRLRLKLTLNDPAGNRRIVSKSMKLRSKRRAPAKPRTRR